MPAHDGQRAPLQVGGQSFQFRPGQWSAFALGRQKGFRQSWGPRFVKEAEAMDGHGNINQQRIFAGIFKVQEGHQLAIAK